MRIMKSNSNNSKTATLVKKTIYNGEEAWQVKLIPGLPYDRDTKGMPHTMVYFVEGTLQHGKHSRNKDAVFVCKVKNGDPDFTFVHKIFKEKMEKGLTILDSIKTLGYNFTDPLKESQRTLVEEARAKLSMDEFDAVRNYKK